VRSEDGRLAGCPMLDIVDDAEFLLCVLKRRSIKRLKLHY